MGVEAEGEAEVGGGGAVDAPGLSPKVTGAGPGIVKVPKSP